MNGNQVEIEDDDEEIKKLLFNQRQYELREKNRQDKNLMVISPESNMIDKLDDIKRIIH